MPVPIDVEEVQAGFFGASPRYQFLAVAGVGAMGVVFKALDHDLDEVIALKVLAGSLSMSKQEMLARFKREVALNRRLRHPNIARVFDYGTSGPYPFLSMEYIDGFSLSDHLGAGEPFRASDAIPILRQVALGIGAAHDAGILHRDLKPQNLMVSDRGAVAILDFGLASWRKTGKATLTGPLSVLGTPRYMAPEQASAEALDARTDLYSVGVIAFEMLTGRVPFDARSPVEIARMHLFAPVPTHWLAEAGLPSSVSDIVVRCLEKSPGRRYASASELEAALAQAARSLAGPVRSSPGESVLPADGATRPIRVPPS